MNILNAISDRMKEPSTWAALASGVALLIGKNPTAASDLAFQVAGGISALLGMFMAENKNPPLH
ncbi:MAG: hypothetical protein HQL73_09660 [Magnetococcales bacterium]|nr:hypothetical protein [Magnetococcales bacterium]